MSVESNMMKVDSEKIKEVLRHHNELTQQIHNQVIDIRKKIDEVEQQSLEMASYPKIDLSATGSGSGIHKDLADVYLNYQRLVKTQESDLTNAQIVSRHKKIINKEIKPGNEEYQQMTLTDILNIGNGEKDG